MRIVADENIPLIEEFFGDHGEIVRLPGRQMCREQLMQADVLLVRSVTRVNADLLAGTRVKFVGTATIGVDHVDVDWLREQGIGFASAPGSNAESVVDYVLSGLLLMSEQDGETLNSRTVGIVGAGNVGSRLQARLEALDMPCLICDPPRAEAEGREDFVDLDTLIERADVICLHTPLIQSGDHATHHLLNAERIDALRPDQILISAGRGECVDTSALRRRLETRRDLRVILDVWEQEPDIDEALCRLVDIATPHVAGYSLDGKMLGTDMIHEAMSRHFGLPARKRLGQLKPDSWLRRITLTGWAPPLEALTLCARACYDIRRDALLLERYRRHYGMAEGFDRMRKEYPPRREFSTLRVSLKHNAGDLRDTIVSAGFSLRLAGKQG
ncbi:4-phosphoerythronate dehydrogenase PdxB [Kushneria phosphatilytica]|uniref:Erythronate-4-phosphate dehydrogenase n=1 Tax=Kushneria phosphatilytica TaxID=657387 RepID=A0A1S1NU77_9GAMM|nr:4-phosphoerythronate dehydrogenase PdxB [Kushneria phosphatilytica]OHV09919.1 4-phosphoerythronate dehydrogenase [Kushneria phosphatilytica]QEL11585.1 4-phosphoerythronate dehydrogenase PdxB [Kushneria phosphatilytica]